MSIYGPFTRETFAGNGVSNTTCRRTSSWWHRQTPPYVLPLPYRAKRSTGVETRFHAAYDGGPYGTPTPATTTVVGVDPHTYAPFANEFVNDPSYAVELSSELSAAKVRSYDRFVRLAHDRSKASVGLSLVERRESINMITRRSLQLWGSFRALKKGDYKAFTKTLGISRTKKGREVFRSARAKDFASGYLELIFGWLPLIGDIGDAMEVLQRDFPTSRISGKSSTVVSRDWVDYYDNSINANVKVRYDGLVRIVNPNLALAGELGFVNPVSVAWQAIPFSFLVDWFLPIGRFLDSYSDFAGMEILYPSTTITREGTFAYRKDYTDGSFLQVNFTGKSVYRDTGFNPPTFSDRLQISNGLSLGKAASAVALVVQLFSDPVNNLRANARKR